MAQSHQMGLTLGAVLPVGRQGRFMGPRVMRADVMMARAVICLLVGTRLVSDLPAQMTAAYTWCRDRHVTNDAGPTQCQPFQVKAVYISW